MPTGVSAARQARPNSIPARAGIGLKPQHYREIVESRPDLGFFEIHAENYMGAGGPPHRFLTRVRDNYPLSIHGVGLSLAGEDPLDRQHLDRLHNLVQRYEPGLVSEHLAWSSHAGRFLADLLPIAFSRSMLDRVVERIDAVQSALRTRILLENPAGYLRFHGSELTEPEFLAEVAQRSGCGLLLDVNNVHVSATNLGFCAQNYLEQLPLNEVAEIHLAGHALRPEEGGGRLLIDSHDQPVAQAVWDLFEQVLAVTGPLPSLLERDGNIPAFDELLLEAGAAERRLNVAGAKATVRPAHVA